MRGKYPELKFMTQGSVTTLIAKLDAHIRKHLQFGIVYVAVSFTSFNNVRTKAQNRLMWPLLTDLSKQVTHYDGKKYSKEDWKDITTAAFEGAMRYAPNLRGDGLVALGARTSRYKKAKMRDYIEFLYAEGTELGVVWSDQSNLMIEEVRL